DSQITQICFTAEDAEDGGQKWLSEYQSIR
ncbi:unnamed protein product, partial [marine sediment metagenome]